MPPISQTESECPHSHNIFHCCDSLRISSNVDAGRSIFNNFCTKLKLSINPSMCSPNNSLGRAVYLCDWAKTLSATVDKLVVMQREKLHSLITSKLDRDLAMKYRDI